MRKCCIIFVLSLWGSGSSLCFGHWRFRLGFRGEKDLLPLWKRVTVHGGDKQQTWLHYPAALGLDSIWADPGSWSYTQWSLNHPPTHYYSPSYPMDWLMGYLVDPSSKYPPNNNLSWLLSFWHFLKFCSWGKCLTYLTLIEAWTDLWHSHTYTSNCWPEGWVFRTMLPESSEGHLSNSGGSVSQNDALWNISSVCCSSPNKRFCGQ